MTPAVFIFHLNKKKSFSWIHSVFARAPKKSNMLTYDPWGKEALMHPRRLVAQSRPHLSGLWWAIYSWYLMTVAKVHKFWIIFWENVYASILYLNCTKWNKVIIPYEFSTKCVCGKQSRCLWETCVASPGQHGQTKSGRGTRNAKMSTFPPLTGSGWYRKVPRAPEQESWRCAKHCLFSSLGSG